MTPPSASSSLEDAQQARVVVDAIAQAGLTARIGFSLVGGLAGRAHRADDDEVQALAERAQQAAERAKNADMSLDLALTGDPLEPVEGLREAARALEQAAEAYETAAEIHERLDAVDE